MEQLVCTCDLELARISFTMTISAVNERITVNGHQFPNRDSIGGVGGTMLGLTLTTKLATFSAPLRSTTCGDTVPKDKSSAVHL